jgi:SAM-dependent methyltransferase
MKDNASETDPVGLSTLQAISKASHFNNWLYDTIRPYLKSDVLEIGSGIGNISAFIIRDSFYITLSDYNIEYCELLRKEYQFIENVRGVLSIDLRDPDFSMTYSSLKEKYNAIFLVNVIEHISDDLSAIGHCRYMLKEGGNLIILAPSYQFLYSRLDKELGHFRRYTVKGLEALFKQQKFKIIHQQYFNVWGILGWIIFGKLLGRKMIGQKEVTAFDRLLRVLKFADNIVFKKIGLSTIVVGQKQG